MAILQGNLFPDFEVKIEKHKSEDSLHRNQKTAILNLHHHADFPVEGRDDMPLLNPFNGTLPEEFIPFSERRKSLYSCGIQTYEYDYKIDVSWSRPHDIIAQLQRYHCVIAPDFSVFVDRPRALNIFGIYKNRWVASYWQKHGITVIPSASWGNVDSFEYCFDGLPENSTIAIGHISIGKDKWFKKLYRLGVETLIDRKHPTRLLVYGAPLDFNPGIEVAYYEGRLQKMRR